MEKSVVCFFIVFVVMLAVLCGCSTKLNGKYTSDGFIEQSFTFDGDNVTMSAFGINADGTYKIADGKITITYKLLNLSYDWTKDFEKKGNSIYIDGTEFIKE